MDTTLTCSLCENTYEPVILGACGHECCGRCLRRKYFRDGHLACHICRKDHEVNTPEDLPANFSLSSLTDTDLQDEPWKKEVGLPGSKIAKKPNKNETKKNIMMECGSAVGSLIAMAAAPLVLSAVGFKSDGIAPESMAARMMSRTATANRGRVPSRSLVSVLQSAGTSGIGTPANHVVGTLGGIIGRFIGAKLSEAFDME